MSRKVFLALSADDEFFGMLHDCLTYRTPICTSREGAMVGMKLALAQMDHGIGTLPGAAIALVNRCFASRRSAKRRRLDTPHER